MEVGWIVGPIPVDDGVGKEVIVRYLCKLAKLLDAIFGQNVGFALTFPTRVNSSQTQMEDK